MAISKSKIAAIGSTIHAIHIDIIDGSGSYSENKIFRKRSEKVILNNGRKVVLDDDNYTSFSIDEDSYGIKLEKPLVHIAIADPLMGNHISFMLYTERDFSKKELKDFVFESIEDKLKGMVSINLIPLAEFIECQ